MTSAVEEQLRLERLHRLLADQLAECVQLKESLPALAQRAAEDRATRSIHTRRRLDEEYAAALQRVTDTGRAVEESARHKVQAAVDDLAPGALSTPWHAPALRELRPMSVTAQHLRVGSFTLCEGNVPAILPLLGTAGWAVRGDQDAFVALAQGVLHRAFAALGPFALNVVTYDPALAMGGGAFSGLRQVTLDAIRPTVTSPEGFDAECERLLTNIGRIGDDLAAQGFASLADATAVRGRSPHAFQLLVINDGLEQLSDTGWSRLRQLVVNGRASGLSVLVRASDSHIGRPELDGLLLVTLQHRQATAEVLGGTCWQVDVAPPPELVFSAVDQVARWEVPSKERLGLAELVEEMTDRWIDPGDQGVRALVGRSAGRPLYLELRSENPAMPHGLVGGAVGQGTSNLLLVIIHALAAQYAPTDLQMVLLDFGDGVEFSSLAPRPDEPSWLPHAMVLGLGCDREFGQAVLEEMSAELLRRRALFKEAGVDKITDYRLRSGQAMPRRLLVVDEFQRLLDGDDETAERCTQLLCDVARTGAGAGFHVILASHEISGIRGSAARADAILGQFQHRISLRNTTVESAAILAPGNVAAAGLVQRGELIANDAFGKPEANRVGLAAHADSSYLTHLRRELWLSAPPDSPPRVFRRPRGAGAAL